MIHGKAKLIYKTNKQYCPDERNNIFEQQNNLTVVNRKTCNLSSYGSNPFSNANDTQLISLQLSSQMMKQKNEGSNEQKFFDADQDLQHTHTNVMLNNCNSLDRNYVPLINNSTTDSTSAYYCLEVNSNDHFEPILNDMKENEAAQQSFTSTIYREMSI